MLINEFFILKNLLFLQAFTNLITFLISNILKVSRFINMYVVLTLHKPFNNTIYINGLLIMERKRLLDTLNSLGSIKIY